MTERGRHQTVLNAALISIVVALLIGAAVAYIWILPALKGDQSDWIAPAKGELRLQGKVLYEQYCASCHGVDMQGQFNWRTPLPNGRLPAPPHDVTGHTWHHPDWQLRRMIKDGFTPGVMVPSGYESDMPAFGSILNDDQIDAILGYIKSVWPEKALEAQREISLKSKPPQ